MEPCGRVIAQETDRTLFVDFVDELDISNVDETRAILAHASTTGQPRILISFERAKYCDARTMSVLTDFLGKVKHKRIAVVTGPSLLVRTLMSLMGMQRFATVVENKRDLDGAWDAP